MDDTEDEVHLLSAVVPAFLEVAKYYTGSGELAKRAREELGKQEQFYAGFQLELQQLSDSLRLLDGSFKFTENQVTVIVYVLKGLESRTQKEARLMQELESSLPTLRKVSSPFPRLQILRQVICHIPSQTQLLSTLLRCIFLADSRRRHRNRLLRCLVNCNEVLRRIINESNKARSFDFQVETDINESPEINDLLDDGIREAMRSLHKLLTGRWECTCESPHVETMLRLTSLHGYRKDVNIDMLFNIPTQNQLSEGLLWQESKICILSRRPPGSKSVGFQIIDTDISHINRTENRRQVRKLCPLIASSSGKVRRCLNLILEHNDLFQISYDVAAEMDQERLVVKLSDFLGFDTPFPLSFIKDKEKRILGVLLANTLLQLHEGPWLQTHLRADNICFYHVDGQSYINLRKPYVSTVCTTQSADVNEEDAWDRVHPYPSILALGILLLQIELSEAIDNARARYFPNAAKIQEASLDAYIGVAKIMLDECRGDSPDNFVKAVAACISQDTFRLHNQSFEDSRFRNEIYQYIVKPLEKALFQGWEINLEDLDTQPLGSTLKPYPLKDMVRVPDKLRSALNSSKLKQHIAPPLASQSPAIYATTSQISIQPEGIESDSWFVNLERYVHPLVSGSSVVPMTSPTNGIICRPVRIAILDTGVDFPLPPCYSFDDRIAGYKDWVDEGNNIKRDLDGHGTHSTGLLMKVAPNAHIYVERVFKNGDCLKGKAESHNVNDIIAKAIRHAVDFWDVDIISMSFGFDQSDPGIYMSICHAQQNNTILLAAASNEGGNAGIAWPARLPEVICIHASDGKGNKAKFTPSSQKHMDNFIILGEEVMSSWPMHLNQGHQVRKSGTSCATPIAAGIAAIVLDFAEQYLSRPTGIFSTNEKAEFTKLKTVAGMRVVFRLMAQERDTYDYIRPWEILKATGGYKVDSIMDMIFQNLKKWT